MPEPQRREVPSRTQLYMGGLGARPALKTETQQERPRAGLPLGRKRSLGKGLVLYLTRNVHEPPGPAYREIEALLSNRKSGPDSRHDAGIVPTIKRGGRVKRNVEVSPRRLTLKELDGPEAPSLSVDDDRPDGGRFQVNEEGQFEICCAVLNGAAALTLDSCALLIQEQLGLDRHRPKEGLPQHKSPGKRKVASRIGTGGLHRDPVEPDGNSILGALSGAGERTAREKSHEQDKSNGEAHDNGAGVDVGNDRSAKRRA